MKIKSGTVGEVVPGSGLMSYPASTTTGINNAIPHLGYVANLGYFGETYHNANSLTLKTSDYQDGQNGISPIEAINREFNGSTGFSNKYLTSALTQSGNYSVLNSTGRSANANVNYSYTVGTSITADRNLYGNLGYSSTNWTSVQNPDIKTDYFENLSHGTNYYRTNRQSTGTPPRELKSDGSLEIKGPDNSYADYDCNFTGQGEGGLVSGVCGGPPTKHTNPTLVNRENHTQQENLDYLIESYYTLYYWREGYKYNENVFSEMREPYEQYGIETPDKPLIKTDLRNGDLIDEPGFYLLHETARRTVNDLLGNFSFYHTPVINTSNGNAKIAGKRGKGKEWVMIEEDDNDERKEGNIKGLLFLRERGVSCQYIIIKPMVRY